MKKIIAVLAIISAFLLTGCGPQPIETENYAPKSVRNSLFYGRLEVGRKRVEKHIVSPFVGNMRTEKVYFHKVHAPKGSAPANSGFYVYEKTAPNTAIMSYRPTRGLKTPILLKFHLTFTRRNAGTFSAKIYKFRYNRHSLYAPASDLSYLRTQHGSFYFVK